MTGPFAFPLIEIEGDARARGLSYGRAAADRIGAGLEIYRPILASAGLEWDAALRIARRFIDQLFGFDAAQAEELRAIAEGAGLRPEEVMVVNARTDLLYGAQGETEALDDGCTGAVALPQVTGDGHLIHAQNWDWRDDCKRSVVIVKNRPIDGPATLNLMEAGTLARCGLNAHGLALTANFLRCDHDPQPGGVPSPFVRRRALGARDLASAARILLAAPRSFSNNLMLSDDAGLALDLETTPREAHWIKPEAGLLVHANHFTSPGARARLHDTGLHVTPDSLDREDRMREALARQSGAITIDTMCRALADDFAAPASVNRPPTPGPGGENVSTVASIVMDVTGRTMTVVPTPYENAESTTYTLET